MARIAETRNLYHKSNDGKWTCFYASGSRGKFVRADGNGKAMSRGWYRRDNVSREHYGPFTSLEKAKKLS